jgi:hypothetical protein
MIRSGLFVSFQLENVENATMINPFASSSHKLYLSRQVSHDCVLPSDEYEGDMSLHYMRPKGTFYTPQALLHQHQKLRALVSYNPGYAAGPLAGNHTFAGAGGGFRSRLATMSGGSMSGPSTVRSRYGFLDSFLYNFNLISSPILGLCCINILLICTSVKRH